MPDKDQVKTLKSVLVILPILLAFTGIIFFVIKRKDRRLLTENPIAEGFRDYWREINDYGN